MYVSQTICVLGQRSWLQCCLEEQKFRLPARHAAGLELTVPVDGQTARHCNRHGSGSLLPSHWLLHTHIPLLDPLKNGHRIQMVTWGGTNCWTPMGAGWEESISYTFISKCDGCSLEGHCAGQWLLHVCHWAKFNLIHCLPVVCTWGELLPTSKVLVRSDSDDTGPGHHDFLDLGLWIFHCLLAKQHIEKSYCL